MRLMLRMAGALWLAAAFAAVLVDGTRSIAAQDIMWFSVGDTFAWLDPGWTARVDNLGVGSRLPAGPGLVAAASSVPISAAAVALGLMLLWLGRRPRQAPSPRLRRGSSP